MANPENIEPYKFKKGQSGNPAGRPKKRYAEHISDLRKKGYEPPCREEYFEMIGMLMAMDEDDLKVFALDRTKPYWIRIIITDMNSISTRQKMMSDYRDWIFGRAQQSIDQNITLDWHEQFTDDPE